jgi:hypothetical protein
MGNLQELIETVRSLRAFDGGSGKLFSGEELLGKLIMYYYYYYYCCMAANTTN